jgi:hypothetical protein
MIVEEEIVANDLKEKATLRFDDLVDHPEALLGKTIDNDVISIIKGGPPEQAIKHHDKFRPQLRGKMSMLDGRYFFCH